MTEEKADKMIEVLKKIDSRLYTEYTTTLMGIKGTEDIKENSIASNRLKICTAQGYDETKVKNSLMIWRIIIYATLIVALVHFW